MRIKVHPGLCQAHGVCHRFASSVYQLDDEGYIALRLLEVPPELEAAALDGAAACPSQAITILRDADDMDDSERPLGTVAVGNS